MFPPINVIDDAMWGTETMHVINRFPSSTLQRMQKYALVTKTRLSTVTNAKGFKVQSRDLYIDRGIAVSPLNSLARDFFYGPYSVHTYSV